MVIDASNILNSLIYAALTSGGLALFVGLIFFAGMPRFRRRWKASQPARISMPCDPVALHARLAEALWPYGFHPVGAPGGPFTLEPSGFRRKLGVTTITVAFPTVREAVIFGQAGILAKLSASGEVCFVPEGAVPFRTWLRQRMVAPMAWIAGISFMTFFLIFLLA